MFDLWTSAFGVQDRVRYSGVIEIPGLPTRPKLKHASNIPPEEASANPTPDDGGRQRTAGAKSDADRPPVDDRRIDEALQDTFPASDPPFFVGAGAGSGLQPTAEADATALEDRRPVKHEKQQN